MPIWRFINPKPPRGIVSVILVQVKIRDFSGGPSPLGKTNSEVPLGHPPLVTLPKAPIERPKPKRRTLDFGVNEVTVAPSSGDSHDKLGNKTQPLRLLPIYLTGLTIVAVLAFVWLLCFHEQPDRKALLSLQFWHLRLHRVAGH